MEDDQILAQEQEESDSFLDGWEEEGGAEADAPAEESASEEPASAEPDGKQEEPEQAPEEEPAPRDEDAQEAPETPETPRMWTLRQSDGQPVTVGEADLTALAQRGLEADGLRAELDETRPFMEFFRGFAQNAGMEPRAYLSALRMQAMQAQGMTQEDARRAVELEDREAAVKAQEAAEQARQAQIREAQERARNLEARRRAEVQEFLAVFPDAAKTQLPPEVWDGVNQGLSLTAAYVRYTNAQAAEAAKAAEEAAKQAEAVQEQNAANAARSTGSLRTAGTDHGPKDPFLEGWEED